MPINWILGHKPQHGRELEREKRINKIIIFFYTTYEQ